LGKNRTSMSSIPKIIKPTFEEESTLISRKELCLRNKQESF
jgi:hypothetical protein